jgi:hypothetical protein
MFHQQWPQWELQPVARVAVTRDVPCSMSAGTVPGDSKAELQAHAARRQAGWVAKAHESCNSGERGSLKQASRCVTCGTGCVAPLLVCLRDRKSVRAAHVLRTPETPGPQIEVRGQENDANHESICNSVHIIGMRGYATIVTDDQVRCRSPRRTAYTISHK